MFRLALNFYSSPQLPPKCQDYRYSYQDSFKTYWESNLGHYICQASALPTALYPPTQIDLKFLRHFLRMPRFGVV